MKKTILYSAIIGLLILQSSCEIQKRKHTPGYHFSFHKNTKSKVEKQETLDAKHEKTTSHAEEVQASTNETYVVLEPTNQGFDNPKWEVKAVEPSDSCDEVILNNGEVIAAKVLEISSTELKYKRCGNLTGPTIVKPIGEVFMVRYSNGEKDVFEKKQASAESNPDSRNYAGMRYREKRTMVMASTGLNIGSVVLSTIASYFYLTNNYLFYLIGVILGITAILAIIFSSVSIGRINRMLSEKEGKSKEDINKLRRQLALAIFNLVLSVIVLIGCTLLMLLF